MNAAGEIEMIWSMVKMENKKYSENSKCPIKKYDCSIFSDILSGSLNI